jgi:CRP/FNR family transcriptional regulator, cyclic AMP receptor protein
MADNRIAGTAFFKGTEAVPIGATVRTFEAGSVVIDRDDAGLDVCIPLSGRFRVSLITLQGRELLLRDLGPGDLFGEVACFEGKTRSARITALTNGDIAIVPGAAFRNAVLGSPILSERLIVMLVARQRELSERLEEVSSLSVLGRLCRDLLRWSMPRSGTADERVISPPPTNGEIAARIGCRPEQVSRGLNDLIRTGALSRTKGALIISDVAHVELHRNDVARDRL